MAKDKSVGVREEFVVPISILTYSTCSISMILLNKLVIDTYGMDYPMGLLVLQNAAAVILVSTCKFFNIVFYPDFDMKVVKKWLPLTLLYVAMLWTSMKSLKTMSVAAQTILKNLAIIFTAIGDNRFFGKPLSVGMFTAFGMMIFGSYLGSATDRWVTSWGVFWTFMNISSTVSYVLYMKVLLGQVSKEIGNFGPVFYNNLLSLPFLIVPAFVQLSGMVDSITEASRWGIVCLLLMLLDGAVITFASFWCMKSTGPTTYSVVGSLNKVPLALLGIFIFGHYPTLLGYVGISCALTAGVIYAWVTRPPPKPTVVPPTEDERLEEGHLPRRIV